MAASLFPARSPPAFWLVWGLCSVLQSMPQIWGQDFPRPDQGELRGFLPQRYSGLLRGSGNLQYFQRVCLTLPMGSQPQVPDTFSSGRDRSRGALVFTVLSVCLPLPPQDMISHLLLPAPQSEKAR